MGTGVLSEPTDSEPIRLAHLAADGRLGLGAGTIDQADILI